MKNVIQLALKSWPSELFLVLGPIKGPGGCKWWGWMRSMSQEREQPQVVRPGSKPSDLSYGWISHECQTYILKPLRSILQVMRDKCLKNAHEMLSR